MSTDDLDIESILSSSDVFRRPPTISYGVPDEEISRFIVEHADSGIPCVITGFPHNEESTQESPFTHSEGWLESFYRPQGKLCRLYALFL